MTTKDLSPTFALDFETTGPDPRSDRVLEVGLAGPHPYHAMVTDAGARVFAGLLAALGPGPVRILAHNAGFERSFLQAWADRLGRTLPEIEWICTLAQARGLCPDPSLGKGLEPLAARLGLGHGDLHRAPVDAALTLRLHGSLQAWAGVQSALGRGAPLVYLAGPVRGDGSRACMRFNHARMLAQAQWAQGVLPRATLFVPHGNFAYLDESEPSGRVRELALRGCLQVLSRCDALVLCAAEPSPGMLLERQLARNLGLPVFQVPGWDPEPAARRAEGAA